MAILDRGTDLDEIKGRLLPWLKAKIPHAENVTISGLEKTVGGVVNDTHFFDLSYRKNDQEYVEKLVIRWPPKVAPAVPGHNMALTCRLVKNLKRAGLPVINVRWLEEDKAILGFPFVIMDKIEGDAPSDFPPGFHGHGFFFDTPPEKRADLWWKSVDAMASLHKPDWKALEIDFLGAPANGTDALNREIDHWERLLNEKDYMPWRELRAGIDWLRKNVYNPEYLSLCWGDARPGNLLYRDGEVVAILDWDLAYIGPPENDLAYFILMDKMFADTYRVPRLAGLPEEDETIAYYEKLIGRKVINFEYHRIFTLMILGVMAVCATEAVILSGGPKELATQNYGTRGLRETLNL